MDQQLLVFVKVVEKGNFSKAAEELHMTQPAVSQYIQSLERMYGTKLLERTNKYVRLNKPGQIVYDHAKEIIGIYSKISGLLDDLANAPKGPLAIGASYSFGEYVLPHFISQLHSEFPQIQPSIRIGNTKDITELVVKNQLDIGIIEGDYHDRHLVVEPFADDFMYVIASAKHPLAKEKGEISVQSLEKETWIIREEGSGTREATDKLWSDLSISPKDVMVFGSTQIIKESVEAGLGIALLSQVTFHKEQQLDLINTLPVAGTPYKRKFSIVLRKTSYQTKAMEVFIELLRVQSPAMLKL